MIELGLVMWILLGWQFVLGDDRADELVALSRDNGSVQWRQSVGYELETVTTTSQGVFVASSVNDLDGGGLIRFDAVTLDGARRW